MYTAFIMAQSESIESTDSTTDPVHFPGGKVVSSQKGNSRRLFFILVTCVAVIGIIVSVILIVKDSEKSDDPTGSKHEPKDSEPGLDGGKLIKDNIKWISVLTDVPDEESKHIMETAKKDERFFILQESYKYYISGESKDKYYFPDDYLKSIYLFITDMNIKLKIVENCILNSV